MTVMEPQRVAILRLQDANGGAPPEPPPGITLARVVAETERERYAEIRLPNEEILSPIGGVWTILPEHSYEVRLHGDPVFTLHSLVLLGATDNKATGGAADPPQPDEGAVLQGLGDDL